MFRWLCCKKTGKSAGFALLDILIGITLISVALVGIAFAYRQSTVTTVSARNYNQATYYAQQALEKLKVNDGKPSAIWNPVWPPIPANGSTPAFTITTAVLPTGEAPEYDALSSAVQAKLIPVQAKVSWLESGGTGSSTRSVSIVGYYYLK